MESNMADEEELFIGGKPISSLRVVDLKKECDKRSLSKSGSKSQLVERLKTHMLFENLQDGKGAAKKPQLEEDCQNEFIKQYLAQQKQLIENAESSMTSSSQESDTEESPKKQPKQVEQSPPIRSPPLEISPEKAGPIELPPELKKTQEIRDAPSSTKEKRKSVEGKEEIPEVKTPTRQKQTSGEAERKETNAEVSNKQPSNGERGVTAEEVTTEGQGDGPDTSKGQGTEESANMGRGRRRLSRLDSDTKSQETLEPVKPNERRSRRTRSSRSTGSELDESGETTQEKSADEPVKVEEEKPVQEQEKKPEPVQLKEQKVEEPERPKAVKESPKKDKEAKDPERPQVEKETPKKDEKQQEDTKKESTMVDISGEKSPVNKVEARSKDEVPSAKQMSPKKKAPEPQTTKPIADGIPEKMDTSERKEGSSPARAKIERLQEKPGRRRSRLSSSSSSDSSPSPSRDRGKKRTERSSSSSSSSRSRSRTPEIKRRIPVQPSIGRKPDPIDRSSSSSRSRSRSPSPKRVKKQEESKPPVEKKSPPSAPEKPVTTATTEKPATTAEVKVRRQRSRSPSPEADKRAMEVDNEKADTVGVTDGVVESIPARDSTSEKNEKPEVVSEPVVTREAPKVPEAKATKKISLNRKTLDDAGSEKGGEASPASTGASSGDVVEKVVKKRKWGSRSTSSSVGGAGSATTAKLKKPSTMSISTDSLKGLMPDIKPSLKLAPEPILDDEMDYEDDTMIQEHAPAAPTTAVTMEIDADTRAVKIQRTVTQNVGENKSDDEASDDSDDDSDKSSGDENDNDKAETTSTSKPAVAVNKEKPDDASGEGEKDSSSEDEGEDTVATKDGRKVSDLRQIQREIKQEVPDSAEGTDGRTVRAEDVGEGRKTTVITKKIKKEKKDIYKEIKVFRRLESGDSALIKADEPQRVGGSPSPARNPVGPIIHIRNLVRPFTLNQLKELLTRNGSLVADGFWIDKIKSHCFATYETDEAANLTRQFLHNTRWPTSNPKTLTVDFAAQDQLDYYRAGMKPMAAPDKRPAAGAAAAKVTDQRRESERERKIKEEREKEFERRRKEREQRMKEREGRSKDRAGPVREWDKDKKSREDWDRTLQRSRSRSPGKEGGPARGRQRSSASPGAPGRGARRGRDSGEREQLTREKRKEKKDNEPPAKLLDDLFKKTKVTPCIYWLPITEAEVAAREKAGYKRPVLRLTQRGDQFPPEHLDGAPMEEPDGAGRSERQRGGRSSSGAAGKSARDRSDERVREIDERGRGRRMSPERRRRDSSPSENKSRGGRRR